MPCQHPALPLEALAVLAHLKHCQLVDTPQAADEYGLPLVSFDIPHLAAAVDINEEQCATSLADLEKAEMIKRRPSLNETLNPPMFWYSVRLSDSELARFLKAHQEDKHRSVCFELTATEEAALREYLDTIRNQAR